MAGLKTPMILAIISFLVLSLSIINVEGGPNTVSGEIQISGLFPVVIEEDVPLRYNVTGSFSVSKDLWDVGTYATLSITTIEGDWEPGLEDDRWDPVQDNVIYDIEVMIFIPNGTKLGEQASYRLTLTFYNNLDQEVHSDVADFSIRIDKVNPSRSDDDDDGRDPIEPTEDDSFPLWPFFIVIMVIGLVIAGIWVKKNIEFVREEDGSRRVMMREKDTGRIVGRKKQPPPELDL